MEHRWYGTLLVLCVVLALGLTAGCITVVKEKPDGEPGAPASVLDPPLIATFAASPDSIHAGEQSNLSWEVSGATKVSISPVVGSVGSSSQVLVSPTSTTTYMLTASNAAGESTAKVTVNVALAAAVNPDLVITDIWIQGGVTVYYKIKNQGSGDARGSRAFMYLNDVVKTNDYAEALAAGEERTESFKTYAWPYIMDTYPGYEPIQYNIKVCADAETDIVEIDETNNCTTVIWGYEFAYRFLDYAHMAEWVSGAGKLTFPRPAGSASGAVFVEKNMQLEDGKTHASIIATYPQQVDNGWVQGEFADYYTDRDTRETKSRPFVLPEKAKFTALVGFKKGAEATAGVTFKLGAKDEAGTVTYYPEQFAAYDGTLDLFEVDLSELADKKITFILRVEAAGPNEQDWAVWVDPRIGQER